MTEYILHDKAKPKSKREVLVLKYHEAKAKVTHADTFRQRNMNYALIIFAGVYSLGFKYSESNNSIILSILLTTLMIIFCAWDRRWHKHKHGWSACAKNCYDNLVDLTNNESQEIKYLNFISGKKGSDSAEWTSFQPIVFYFLIVGAAASFFLF